MGNQPTKYEIAKEYAANKWNDAAYEKAQKKDFVFTIREQKEMCKQDFVAGFNMGSNAEKIKLLGEALKTELAKTRALFAGYVSDCICESDREIVCYSIFNEMNWLNEHITNLLNTIK